MQRLLFTVEDTFSLRDRGVILVPGITPDVGERFLIGDKIELRSPNGSRSTVPIGGIDMTMPNPLGQIFIMLRGIVKDVPVGTQVWSIT